MRQSSEHEVVELLRHAPHFKYPSDAEEKALKVLRSVQGTHKHSRIRKQFSWLFQAGASVAAVAILGAGLWVYKGQTVTHQMHSNTLASSNVSKNQSVKSSISYVIPQKNAILPGYRIIAQFETDNSTNHYYTFYEGIDQATGYRVDESAIPSNGTLSMMTPSQSDQYGDVSTIEYKRLSITVVKSKFSPRMWTYYFTANGRWFQVNATGGNPSNDLKVINSLITNPRVVQSH